jgi:peptide/nickel transport system substrate-binding protein
MDSRESQVAGIIRERIRSKRRMPRPSRRFGVVGVMLFVLALSQATAAERGEGDTLRLLFWQAPTIVNPHLSIGSKDLTASRIVYEPLASFDKDGRLIPLLAAEIPSRENGGVAPDGRSVTWTLKQGIKWADGAPFTADDVLFTFQYASNPAVGTTTSATYEVVESVELIDDHRLTVRFKDVNPAWALPFVGVNGMIIPRHVFAPYNGANAQDAPANLQAVGTGPYRVVAFQEEDILIIGDDAVSTVKIVYEPNPHFREADKPYFSKVELRGGGDAGVAAEAVLKEGSIDYGYNLQVEIEVLEQLEAYGKGVLLAPPTARTERIMINFSDPDLETPEGERSSRKHPHPILSDKAVRRALSHAIDRGAITKLYGRAGRPASNLLISPARFASPNTSWTYDLEKAAALLDEAGWVDSDGDGLRDKDGRRLSLVFQTSVNAVRQETQAIIKQALASIGVEIELKIIDSSVFFGPVRDSTNTRRHFYADLEEFSFSNKSPDPGAYMRAWTCDEAAQQANNWSASNWARYCNPAFDALYAQSTTELDPDKRRDLIIAMNDLLIEDVAVIPMVERSITFGISTSLEGVDPTPWDADVWNIKDWRRK